MKKRIRKGSLLIALSLLLAMMMGMSVHAAGGVYELYSHYGDKDYSLSDRVDETILFNDGDKIMLGYKEAVKIVKIDGTETTHMNMSGGDISYISISGTYIVTEYADYNSCRQITLQAVQDPAPAPGDPAPETDNSSNENTKTEEPQEPQEPKESEEQIFTRELLTRAETAKAGDSVAIDATLWHSFNAKVLEELLSKEGVSYTFYYNYGGECFYITIPAGAVLEEGCEWYGPLKLNAMFGRTMIDKKDLHAAINQ